jgi:hypothetical protein
MKNKKMHYNSDGALINCLLQPGQFHHDTIRSFTYRDNAKKHANPDTYGNIKPPGRNA